MFEGREVRPRGGDGHFHRLLDRSQNLSVDGVQIGVVQQTGLRDLGSEPHERIVGPRLRQFFRQAIGLGVADEVAQEARADDLQSIGAFPRPPAFEGGQRSSPLPHTAQP